MFLFQFEAVVVPLTIVRDQTTLSATDSFFPMFDDIPVPLVFERLKGALQGTTDEQEPTVEMVGAALDRLEVAARQGHDEPIMPMLPASLLDADVDTTAAPAASAAAGTPTQNDRPPEMALDSFFATPPRPAVLAMPQVQRKAPARPRRSYDMSNVRRSARLAKKPALPAVQRAQVNLCRKLGLVSDEHVPVEQILAEYVAMYNGPLPSQIVAALSSVFGLDDDLTDQLDGAMLELVGEGVQELQEGGDPAAL